MSGRVPRVLFLDRRPHCPGEEGGGGGDRREGIVNINAAGTGKGKYLNNNY